MPKTKRQKAQEVASIKEKVERSKAVVFANFAGLTVKDVTQLRKLCREAGGEYLVAKKTLMRKAFTDAKLDVDPEKFPSEVATIFGYEDEVAPSRVVVQFSKDHPAVKPFGGLLERRYVDGAKVRELSALPSKLELIAKVVGSVRAPLSGMVNVLAGNLRGLVQVLKALSEKKPA